MLKAVLIIILILQMSNYLLYSDTRSNTKYFITMQDIGRKIPKNIVSSKNILLMNMKEFKIIPNWDNEQDSKSVDNYLSNQYIENGFASGIASNNGTILKSLKHTFIKDIYQEKSMSSQDTSQDEKESESSDSDNIKSKNSKNDFNNILFYSNPIDAINWKEIVKRYNADLLICYRVLLQDEIKDNNNKTCLGISVYIKIIDMNNSGKIIYSNIITGFSSPDTFKIYEKNGKKVKEKVVDKFKNQFIENNMYRYFFIKVYSQLNELLSKKGLGKILNNSNIFLAKIDNYSLFGEYQNISEEDLNLEDALTTGLYMSNIKNHLKYSITEKLKLIPLKEYWQLKVRSFMCNPILIENYSQLYSYIPCRFMLCYRTIKSQVSDDDSQIDSVHLKLIDCQNKGKVIFSDVIRLSRNLTPYALQYSKKYVDTFKKLVKNGVLKKTDNLTLINLYRVNDPNKDLIRDSWIEESLSKSIMEADINIIEKIFGFYEMDMTSIVNSSSYFFSNRFQLYLNNWIKKEAKNINELNVNKIVGYFEVEDENATSDERGYADQYKIGIIIIDLKDGGIIYSDIVKEDKKKKQKKYKKIFGKLSKGKHNDLKKTPSKDDKEDLEEDSEYEKENSEEDVNENEDTNEEPEKKDDIEKSDEEKNEEPENDKNETEKNDSEPDKPSSKDSSSSEEDTNAE